MAKHLSIKLLRLIRERSYAAGELPALEKAVAEGTAALRLARELRRSGLRIELGDGSFRVRKSMELADKLARQIVLLGEDELASDLLTVKDFSTGVQTKIPRADLAAHLLAARSATI